MDHTLRISKRTCINARSGAAAAVFRAGLLAPCLMLAACGPWNSRMQDGPLVPPAQPVSIPERWSRDAPPANAAALADWWAQFGDPRLTLLIAQAQRNSTSVAIAEARLKQARALRDLAGAGLATYVSASVSAERVREQNSAPRSSYHAGLDASWEPDLYGYRRQGLSASEATVRAEALTLEDARVSLAAEVALAYIELRGVQQRQALARAYHVRQQLLLDMAGRRTGSVGAEIDRQRARAALALAAAALPGLDASRAQLEHSLALLCGDVPDALTLDLALPSPSRIPEAPDELALSLPADTLRQRPDVRAAAARVSAVIARVGQADAARKPVVRLEGTIGLRGLGIGGAGSSVLRGLFGAISGTAFDGGSGQARVAAEQGALLENYALLRASVLMALREVEDALAGLAADRARRLALQEAVAAAAQAATLAMRAYQDDALEFQTVLDTQRTLLASEDELVQATVAQGTSHVRLYKALGGGWQGSAAPLP
ncbi:efflux transporter outer membrane subunit [Pseudoduganella rivuli]|nr:efflux transporter outer membrane subunit [Pseudoduganella rivuli]